MDVFIAFSVIIMALAIVAVFGTDLGYVILAIALPFIPDASRIVRSNALALRDSLRRCSTRLALAMHVYSAAYVAERNGTISNNSDSDISWYTPEASLSYLGLGVREPTPAWGLMLQGGAEELAESAPWVPIFPGLAITLAVFGFNLFGDGLRDMLDPRLRRS